MISLLRCLRTGITNQMLRSGSYQYAHRHGFRSTAAAHLAADPHNEVRKKRVLGVIAHINSGKTTTSEAMLYTSGALKRMGNVDVGDTMMDFLPAERERGITVAAAAICFLWRHHQLFLVDSPGHLDFTFEVERALRVMDGVVVILDAVAGVQPQTETVWRQADANRLPRIIFINKMDRDGADYHRTIADVRRFFGATPLSTQLPIFDHESSNFIGVYNLLERFPSDHQTAAFVGKSQTGHPISFSYDDLSTRQKEQVDAAAEHLVEACADVDDKIMGLWLDGLPVPRTNVIDAIRHACVNGLSVPILCGTSLKGIGVEPLLDSLLAYLPSPLERKTLQAKPLLGAAGELKPVPCDPSSLFLAYAFKVTHDKHRGRMVHLRAFGGQLDKRRNLLNTTKGKKETPTRLLRVLADKYEDIESVDTGDIFAAVGLKHTGTGDTIMLHGISKRSQVILSGMNPPPVVFNIALEVDSTSDEKHLNQALNRLTDEDSSLEIRYDEDTGETLLAGMGELHLEVAVDHLQRKLPFEVYKSQPRVSYRESITREIRHAETVNSVIGTSKFSASLDLTMRPNETEKYSIEVLLEKGLFTTEEEEAIREGVLAGLGRGPVVGANMTGVSVGVKRADSSDVENDAVSLRACASRGVQNALKKSSAVLMEPFMRVEATVMDESVGDVVSELTHPSRRRGIIEEVVADTHLNPKGRGGMSRVTAFVPVEGLIGWASKMRSITKGRGDLQMTFAEYRPVDEMTQTRIVEGGKPS